LFKNMECLQKFKQYMNIHSKPTWTSRQRSNLTTHSLSLMFMCPGDNGSYNTSVYRKPRFSGVYTNFYSFKPTSYRPVLSIHCCIARTWYAQTGNRLTMSSQKSVPSC
jgi:hypothetical protein